jgi:tRNA U55 pseudouridine synthase TruB
MSALSREAIGPFALADSIDADDLDTATIAERLLPPLAALSDLPRCEVSSTEADRLAKGQSVRNRWGTQLSEAAAVDGEGTLLAIVIPGQAGDLQVAKGFCSAP